MSEKNAISLLILEILTEFNCGLKENATSQVKDNSFI
jgi:hypothetical protein